MALFGPLFEGVLRGSLPRAYLNLLFFSRVPKRGLKKVVKNGGLRGRFGVIFDLKCWKMFQMLNAAGIFSKSGIYDAFFYKMGTLLFPSLFFKSAKTVILTFFSTFSTFFIKNDHF